MMRLAKFISSRQEASEQITLRIYAWLSGKNSSEAQLPQAQFLLGYIVRYGAAVVGILLATIVIAAIKHITHAENTSLVYLLVVLCLALIYGRGPSVLASVLAFLAYDFFFVPPLHLFTVNDPAEWLSLLALLLTALVVGQLTAEIRRREIHAIASEQRIATLYGLAQAIAVGTDRDRLLHVLTQRTTQEFAAAGIVACAIFLPDDAGHLLPRAIAHTDSKGANTMHLDAPEHMARAVAAWEDNSITALVANDSRQENGALMTFFIPLTSSDHTVGLLSISGDPSIATLVIRPRLTAGESSSPANLFTAFCDQLALALERESLQREAVHAAALRESDRLKDALLSSVTHDLQTPIAAIRIATSSLLQPDVVWSDAERQEILTTLDASIARLSRLVDNLLTLSRIEAGTTMPPKVLYPINDVIATVLDQSDLAGMTKGRKITVDLGNETLLALMDHAQLERVLQNLLDNALKYSPPGSPVEIHACRDMTEDILRVTVTDHGIGIPPDKLNAIFDKFYRIQQKETWESERQPPGTGLGLAICAGIIREHNGRIWAESDLGSGSTLTFTLPLYERPHDDALPNATAKQLQEAT